jgi:RHS repeat-associated protein
LKISQCGGGDRVAPRSNQLVSVSAAGVNQAIGHTRTGHINSFNPAAAAITNLTYNQAGRLASVMAGSDRAAQYTYDAFGQRLVKTGASTTLYQYDPGGHLLEEIGGDGNGLADYIYLEDLPVATLSPGAGQVYFLHVDRLGTPQAATDSSQNVVWIGSYGPFGEMSTAPGLIVQTLRMPGQEFDADTGLYHNGFRDYAPAWGRYLQSDPIGLIGGLNTYSYVGANPVNRTDPLGLDWLPTKEELTNDWNNFKTTVSDELDIARAQYDTLKALGIRRYFALELPKANECLVAVDKKWQEIKESATYKELSALWNTVETVAAAYEEDFLGVIGWVPAAFKTLPPSSCLDKSLSSAPCPKGSPGTLIKGPYIANN